MIPQPSIVAVTERDVADINDAIRLATRWTVVTAAAVTVLVCIAVAWLTADHLPGWVGWVGSVTLFVAGVGRAWAADYWFDAQRALRRWRP